MSDRHRPLYHFLPPANWMNDPNGLIQWKGVYHLFYQYNPRSAAWGDIHWGHASSRDLVHWQHLPVALMPTPGGPDEAGVWSGCALDWDGKPAVMYTGWTGPGEHVCLATGSDDLLSWEKHPANPVIAEPPPGLETLGFRDPCVWRENDRWMMTLGSGFRGIGGAVLLYSSADLIHWEYVGPLIVGDVRQAEPVWTGKMWECPSFFPLGAEHMLMFSAMDLEPSESLYTLYMLGAYQDGKFTPRVLAQMDGGDVYFYAPQAFLDEHGRRIVFGWSREARPVEACLAAGWAGVMTLPRLLEPASEGGLIQRPVPEVELLRSNGREWKNISLAAEKAPGGLLALDGLEGDAVELEVSFAFEPPDSEAAGVFGLQVRRSPGGEELTEIRVDRLSGMLVLDTLRSSTDRDAQAGHFEAPLGLDGNAPVYLRIFLDRSMIEVFANDRAVITARVYPAREDSTGIMLFAHHSAVTVASLRVWDMRSE